MSFDGIGSLASNLFEYEYDKVTWVDLITHLNDWELRERTLQEMGRIYAEGTVLPRFILGAEADRPINAVLKDVYRGWIWQELNFGKVIIENNVGAIALFLVREIKTSTIIEVFNGRVSVVNPALLASAINNVNFAEFTFESDRYRASFAVIASLCSVDLDFNAFNKICREVGKGHDNHCFKLPRQVDGLCNITTFFSVESSTVTLGTKADGSRFMSYRPWGSLELIFKSIIEPPSSRSTAEPIPDGEYYDVKTVESIRARNIRSYFRCLLKETSGSEHLIEVYVPEESRKVILDRVSIDKCSHTVG